MSGNRSHVNDRPSAIQLHRFNLFAQAEKETPDIDIKNLVKIRCGVGKQIRRFVDSGTIYRIIEPSMGFQYAGYSPADGRSRSIRTSLSGR